MVVTPHSADAICGDLRRFAAAAQAAAVLPMLILAAPLIGFRWKFRKLESSEDRFNRDFLIWFAIGPFRLVVFVGLLLGVRIQSIWGAAMWSYVGIVLLFFLQLGLNRDTIRQTLYRSAVCASLISLVFAGRNSLLPHFRGKPSRIHFPGRQFSLEVGELYRQQTGEYSDNFKSPVGSTRPGQFTRADEPLIDTNASRNWCLFVSISGSCCRAGSTRL
jgi:hypothetical protein